MVGGGPRPPCGWQLSHSVAFQDVRPRHAAAAPHVSEHANTPSCTALTFKLPTAERLFVYSRFFSSRKLSEAEENSLTGSEFSRPLRFIIIIIGQILM
mgnify:CR=1 FL=1